MAQRPFHVAADALDAAPGMPEIFDLVKAAVRRHLDTERAGLMLGLANLGGGTAQLVGGFYQVAGNMIVMNKYPLDRIARTRPELHKPFVYHILLHEYLHTLGYLSEGEVRPLVVKLSDDEFGPDHLVTALARDWGPFMDNLVYPVSGWRPEGGFQVEVVRGFDAAATDYIQ